MHEVTHTIGIDPGSTDGALVLLSGRRDVVSWLAYWVRLRKDGRHITMVSSDRPAPAEMGSLHAAVTAWRYETSALKKAFLVNCEGLFVHPRANRRTAVIPLAETVGELLGPLRTGCVGQVGRPMAVQWRSQVLGLTRGVDARAAEMRAVKAGPVRFSWPGRAGWEAVATLPVGAKGAVAEAACIAAWKDPRAAPR